LLRRVPAALVAFAPVAAPRQLALRILAVAIVAGLAATAIWGIVGVFRQPFSYERPAAEEEEPAPPAPPPAPPAPQHPPPAPGPRAPGGACQRDADCAGPDARCLVDIPGGYCVRVGCSAERDDCPAGSVCTEIAPGRTFCAEGACEHDSDCARRDEGFRCTSRQVCWPGRYLPAHLGRTPVGGPCAENAACETGMCVPDKYRAEADGETSEFPGGYCSAACEEAAPGACPQGAVCRERYCLKTCRVDEDCRRASYSCQAGVCRPAPGYPDSVPLGKACQEDDDCGDGACLAAERGRGRVPGGYCSTAEPCDPDVEGACGKAGVCVRGFHRPEPFCAKACEHDEDCRTGEGYVCDREEGACMMPPADPAGVPLGAPCAADAECGEGGQCLRGSRFPNGYCAAPGCRQSPDQPAGPDPCTLAGGLCVSVPDMPLPYCVRSCVRPAECRVRDGYTCHENAVCWYPRIRVTR